MSELIFQILKCHSQSSNPYNLIRLVNIIKGNIQDISDITLMTNRASWLAEGGGGGAEMIIMSGVGDDRI